MIIQGKDNGGLSRVSTGKVVKTYWILDIF